MKKNPGNFRDILHSLYVDGKIKPRNNDKTILQFLDLQASNHFSYFFLPFMMA